MEKGRRALSLGSKPHSNGVFLFRDEYGFLPSIWITKKSKKVNVIAHTIWVILSIITTG